MKFTIDSYAHCTYVQFHLVILNLHTYISRFGPALKKMLTLNSVFVLVVLSLYTLFGKFHQSCFTVVSFLDHETAAENELSLAEVLTFFVHKTSTNAVSFKVCGRNYQKKFSSHVFHC